MAYVTEHLKPRQLWRYFEEISRIPRASKKEREVLDYLLQFAHDHGLDHREDGAGNIVMTRPSHPQFARAPVVVLQSHVDMVCEKNADSSHDFDRDPIILCVEGDWVKAEGTSLGADNGIGIAAMLSILADQELQFGKMEFLFTVEEEVGLNGALALDTKMISGRIMINLDTEEVGALYMGCAGGRDSDLFVPGKTVSVGRELKALRIGVSGLRGGHSGAEIHLGGANAIKLLARVISRLRSVAALRIASIEGGDKHNAIPREAFAVVTVEERDLENLDKHFDRYTSELRRELEANDPSVHFDLDRVDLPAHVFDEGSSGNIIDTVMVVPHGVLAMSGVVANLVETSSNLSSIRTEEESVHIHASHRSSVESALKGVCDVHTSISRLVGARIEQDVGYPGWNPDPASRVLGFAKRGAESVIGRVPDVCAIHAGLECGVIKQKFEGMDAVSMGPTIRGAHSPDERVHIGSVNQFWQILIETLRLINTEVS